MSFQVPTNQTVCFSVYKNTVCQSFDHSFVKEITPRLMRAFDMGEPIWMIQAEMNHRYECWKQPKEKTPLQLAKAVYFNGARVR